MTAFTLVVAILAGVRLWGIEGLVRRVVIDGPSMAPAFCGAHYDVRCGDCGFSFCCDAEHVPSDGQAACPNCGFTENALSDAHQMPAERVVIDRWPLLFRGPRRGEVVALQAPGDSGELAIKRVAALPGERLSIRGGDLFVNDEIVRKSPAELHAMRVLVHDNNFQPQITKELPQRWRPASENSRWRADGTGFWYKPTPGWEDDDWLVYEHWPCAADARTRGVASSILDNDAYNQGDLHRPLNVVRDVMVTFHLRRSRLPKLQLMAIDGDQQFQATVDEAGCFLMCNGKVVRSYAMECGPLSKNALIEFGVCDQQVLLAVGGQTVIQHSYQRSPTSRNSDSGIAADEAPRQLAIGGGLGPFEIDDLKVWRDVYYLDPQWLSRNWQVEGSLGPDEYALLGDNQPVSIDFRQWPGSGVSRAAILGLVRKR